MDEQRQITRYFISLLVFLGLLGTFWGLLGTINAVGAVITNLDMGQGDFGKVFADLRSGLLTPLQGMGRHSARHCSALVARSYWAFWISKPAMPRIGFMTA